MRLTDQTVRHVVAHVGAQEHAMAGATAAVSGALACALGEACVRISAAHHEDEAARAQAGPLADRLSKIHEQLLALADEDSAVIASYASARLAGQEPKGQERLCELPVEMGRLAWEAATALQEFRPLARHVADDLEIAIALLAGATRAASMVLDSNLRIWPEPDLEARFEPALAELRARQADLRPAKSFR
jgi:formiminotetrahydrofolate cyclodeaminase